MPRNRLYRKPWLVPKLRLGNPCLASSCLVVSREAGVSKTAFPSWSLGTSGKESSTKTTKGTNKTAFVRVFRAFRGLYVLPTDQILHGMFFLRNHLKSNEE